MRIGVGSGNPVKRRATEQALATVESGEELLDATIDAVPVPSGVSEQPIGHAETVTGADNRAAAVLDTGAYDLGIGIEGGVARFEGVDGCFLVMWATASQGDRVGRGSGPSLRLPEGIVTRLENGEALGPVLDDLLDTSGVAKRGGAAGALTAGSVDRADALATAVAGAFGPFVSDLYD